MVASGEVIREFRTDSEEETIAAGREIANMLAPPKMILLRGDLGAGKTTLVKGIAEGFDAAERDEVTSPTFTLVHEYRGGRVTVYHLDVYRIESERELETIGIGDLRTDDSILLIEWGEKFASLRGSADGEIVLERKGEEVRRIAVWLSPES